MKKKQRVEKENSERYILTYADLLTLLLAFFIILYSMADPNEQKQQELGGVFESAFKPRTVDIDVTDSRGGERTYNEALTESEQAMMQAVSEQNNLRKLQRQIDQKISEERLDGEVSTQLSSEGLKVTLTNEILFQSGSAELNNKRSIELIDFIGEIIAEFDNKVSVEGHTDNVPIGVVGYDSNWELSSARSLSVLEEILSHNKELDRTRFSATGYGEYNPIADNDTSYGKSKNRRVEIIVKRNYSNGLLSPMGGE